MDHTLCGITSVINPRVMLREHEKKLFTIFLTVLPTSQVGYHASKPIESVVYCFYKIIFNRTESFR